MIQKQGSSQGRAGQQNVTGQLALAWGLKASPRFAWADKEEDRYQNQRGAFGRCLWKNVNWDHICSRSKKADRQDKEEKGEHLGKAITKP